MNEMPAPGPTGGLAACAEANTDICRFLCSRDLVILKRSQKSPDEKPCFLSLRCDPSGGEGVVSVGILSSARNMEVYLGEEYCGTSRGRSVGNVLDTRFVTHPCAASSRGGFLCPSSGSSAASLTLASGTRGRSENTSSRGSSGLGGGPQDSPVSPGVVAAGNGQGPSQCLGEAASLCNSQGLFSKR